MHFDQAAKAFDTQRRKERALMLAAHIREYLPRADLSAMEFGCGTGLIGMALIDRFSSILFVDASKGMIDQVNEKIRPYPHAAAVRIDLMKEPMPQKTFDCIFMSMVLHHIQDTRRILAILYGLLGENGRLIIVDLEQDDGRFHAGEPDFDGHNGFEQARMRALLMAAGFEDIGTKTIYSGEKEVGGAWVPYTLFIAKADKGLGLGSTAGEPTAVVLKRASMPDCGLIHAMQVKAFKPLLDKYKDYETNPGAESLERVQQRMGQSFTDYYLIQLSGLNIGAVRVAKHIPNTCRISPMFILPEFGGHGYAQQAIRLVEGLYPGILRWELDTIGQEAKLCHLYEKMGYQATGKEEAIQPGMTIRFYAKQK